MSVVKVAVNSATNPYWSVDTFCKSRPTSASTGLGGPGGCGDANLRSVFVAESERKALTSMTKHAKALLALGDLDSRSRNKPYAVDSSRWIVLSEALLACRTAQSKVPEVASHNTLDFLCAIAFFLAPH